MQLMTRRPVTTTDRHAGSPGQALAEFAIILVVLMLIVMGVIDLSRAVYVRSVVANAAREGARRAVVAPRDADKNLVGEAVKDWVIGKVESGSVDVSRDDIVVTWPDQYVQVEVTCTFHPATALIARAAGIGPDGIELRGSSTMRREK